MIAERHVGRRIGVNKQDRRRIAVPDVSETVIDDVRRPGDVAGLVVKIGVFAGNKNAAGLSRRYGNHSSDSEKPGGNGERSECRNV